MIVVYIVVGLIILVLLIAAFMPSRFNIEKSIIIERPIGEVMEKISNLNYYQQWNPWQKTDPTSTYNITGNPGTPGHKYAWEGKKIGVGSLTLLKKDDRHVNFSLQFLKPWKSEASDNWHFEPWGTNDTKVTWQNSGQLPWPIARLIGPMLNKQLNQQFEQGLKNLKGLAES